MQIIDGKKYYSIKEIVKKVNEECGTTFELGTATYQRFYRRKFPHIWGKSEEANFQYRLYSEDILIEIQDYYYRKKKIKELWQQVEEMRAKNTAFNNKYKTLN